MKKIILILVALILIGAGGLFFYKQQSQSRRIHSEELFWHGRKALKDNDDVNALKFLTEALAQNPENSEFNLWAGIAAKKLGKNELAYTYIDKAWETGKKEPLVFLNLIATSPLPKKEKMAKFESMANQLTDEQARLELSALLKYQREQLPEAAKLLKELVDKHPQGIYAEFYARILLRLKQPEEALQILEKINRAGTMNSSCYIILSELYFALDDMSKAQYLFTQAQQQGMDTAEVTERYGQNLYFYGKNRESKEILRTIEFPRLFALTDISSAEILAKVLNSSDSELTRNLLKNTTSQFRELLKKSSAGFDRFNRQRFLEEITAALNKFCSNYNNAENSPDAALATPEEFLKKAEQLVKEFPDCLKLPDYNQTAHQSRIILLLIAASEQNDSAIDQLQQLAAGPKRWLEGERYFGKYLLAAIKQPDLDPARNKDFTIATELLRDNPVIELTAADNLTREGKYQEALVIFDKLSADSIILARSPMVQFMRSKALLASGEPQRSEGIMINLLKRGYITRDLLLNLGRLALQLKDKTTTSLVVNTLEKHTSNNPELYLLLSDIRLQQGDIRGAEEELQRLLTSSATDTLKNQALLRRSYLELRADNPEKALMTLDNIKTESTAKAVLKARILSTMNKNPEALKILQSLKTIPTQDRTLYATVLAGSGKLQEAREELEPILNDNPNNVEVGINLALILNGMGKNQEALKTVERIIDRNPDNIRANTIMSQLLLANGKARDAANLAIKVLSLDPQNITAMEILTSSYITGREFIKAAQASEKALKILRNDPFITMQRAIALIELSKQLDRDTVLEKELKQEEKITEAASAEEAEDLDQEVMNLTSDIVFSRAMSELNNSAETKQDTSLSDFADGRKADDLRQEAIELLDTIAGQEAATVLKLEAELLMHQDTKVKAELESGKLKPNELFSFGILADRMQRWDISATAYLEAFKKQPKNPIILNNFANATVNSGQQVTEEIKELLLQAAQDLPQVLNGDSKAVNTAAMVFNFFGKWENTLELQKSYPEAFRNNTGLSEMLTTARANLAAENKTTKDAVTTSPKNESRSNDPSPSKTPNP